MSRTARASAGGICYHAINRGNAKAQVFRKEDDYAAFRRLIVLANERLPMRVLGYCLMPNHFHLVLWPRADHDLSRWMQWLMTSHVRRYHRHYGSSGHVWQGRFKAFPIEEDGHLLTVLRYVERNPVRAGLCLRSEDWLWSSARSRGRQQAAGVLHEWPMEMPADWAAWVNDAERASELEELRNSVNRGTPYGSESWVRDAALRLGLEPSLNPRGRPRDVEK
jgi:putative transposase